MLGVREWVGEVRDVKHGIHAHWAVLCEPRVSSRPPSPINLINLYADGWQLCRAGAAKPYRATSACVPV